uniref:Uncharacterized protein n=1 Tax=Setaria digitata TaxID=48799 RepID=A0A915PNP6_9BILA
MDEVSSRDISLSSLDNVHSRETFHEKEFTAVDIFDATKVTIPTEVSTDRTTSDSSGTDYTTSDSAETGSISISVSAGANHATSDSSGTEKTAFMVPPFLWVGNVNENSFGEGSRDGRKTTDAMNRLTSVNEISSSITDESMLTRSTEYVTKASHTISEESASEDVANINSTVTVAGMLSESEIHQLETTETSRNTYSDFSSSKTTLSSLENKAMSEMGAIVDTDSGTVHVEYHSTIHYDGMKNLLSSPSSVTVSTSSAERSGIDERNDNSVSNKAISTIATNIKDEEMFKESGSYLDSIKSSTVIVPLLFSNLPVMDDESLPVTESFTSTRASKSNVDSVDGKVEMDLMYPSTTSTMPQSDAVNLAYFSKNFAPAPTLTSTKMLSSFGTDIPDDNDARIRSTTESHSTEVTTVESGSMAINNVTSILEISKTGSEDSAFIQEGLLSNRNMKQFMFEGNDSLLSTAESLATASTTTEIPPKNTTDSSEMLSKALSTSTDKKLSVTMSELLNGDNFKHSIAITNNYFAFSQTKTTSSSSESMNRLFADSELITATETASAGETSTLDAGSGKNHPLISGINSTLIATTGDTFTGASHQESSDTKQILSNLTVANPTMAGLFGSMESSTITIQNTNGAGNEIPNSITVADNELKDTTLSAKIPMAIFNITIPSSVFDVKFSSYINRPSIDYNYLLMDEVDYREDEGTNVPSSRIASSTDVEIAFLDDASTNTNETYNDLYLYDDHSLTLTNGSALKNFKTTNVTLTKIPEKHFLPENVSPVVQSNSFVPFDGITEEDRSSVSSVNIANALHFLNAGTRPLETAILDGTLENAVISTALPNFNEFTEKVPDEHDSITAKKAPVRTASSLTDPIKFDLIGQQTNEQFTDADKGEQMIRLTTSLNNAENERSLEYVTATRASEIEEVAFLNISRRKIIHQTSTVLKAEKLTGNDSLTLTSAPRSSTIKPDERNMMENASSFDQISVQEENTTIVFSDLQPQTVDSIAVSSDYEASFSDKESLKLASAANVTSSTDKLPLSTLSSSVIPENSSLQRF